MFERLSPSQLCKCSRSALAAVLMVALPLGCRSADQASATSESSPTARLTFGTPTATVETRNVPGEYELVFNVGDVAIEHPFRKSIPVESSAQVALAEDGKSGSIRITRTTQVAARFFDLTECTEEEIKAITARSYGHHVIADGKHGLEPFPCARLMEERAYDVDDRP